MKVGILVPGSKTYPSIGIEFMEAVKTCLKNKDLYGRFEFFSESIGLGGSEKEVYEKAEKLLMFQGVDLLLAYIDEKVLDILQPLVYASGKLMIVINPGANYPLNWIPQPNIIRLTLMQAFCCHLSGALAVSEPGVKASFASTFYDCGYMHGAAITNSFVEKGGHISFNYINNTAYNNEFQINELLEFLKADNSTRNLLCIFDTLPAGLFYSLLDSYDDAAAMKLFASPMMLEEKAVKTKDGGFNFVIAGYTTWLPQFKTDANMEFCSAIHAATKKQPSCFSLLGWETALVMEQLLTRFTDHEADGNAMVDFLKTLKLASPRGLLILDDATQYYLSEPLTCILKPGTQDLEITVRHDYLDEWKRFSGEPIQGAVAGWTNTYLCY